MAHEIPTLVVRNAVPPWHNLGKVGANYSVVKEQSPSSDFMDRYKAGYLEHHHLACWEYFNKELTYYVPCICDYIDIALGKEEE